MVLTELLLMHGANRFQKMVALKNNRFQIDFSIIKHNRSDKIFQLHNDNQKSFIFDIFPVNIKPYLKSMKHLGKKSMKIFMLLF